MLIFYDLSAKDSIKTWTPNTWKTRYVLNFKALPYKTVYLEFPELKSVLQKAGAQPLVSQKHGMVFYTSPAIVDNATEPAISDSLKIAEYLDKQYPNTPKALPPGSEALQAAFHDQFAKTLFSFAHAFSSPSCTIPPLKKKALFHPLKSSFLG